MLENQALTVVSVMAVAGLLAILTGWYHIRKQTSGNNSPSVQPEVSDHSRMIGTVTAGERRSSRRYRTAVIKPDNSSDQCDGEKEESASPVHDRNMFFIVTKTEDSENLETQEYNGLQEGVIMRKDTVSHCSNTESSSVQPLIDKIVRSNSIQNKSLKIMRQRRKQMHARRRLQHSSGGLDRDTEPDTNTENRPYSMTVPHRSFHDHDDLPINNGYDLDDSDDGFNSDVSEFISADEKIELSEKHMVTLPVYSAESFISRRNSVQERLWKIRVHRKPRAHKRTRSFDISIVK